VLGGLEYAPFEGVFVSPMIGYRWENQGGIRDRGVSYTFGALAPGIDADGYLLSAAAQFHEDRVNPRRLQRHFVHVGAEKLFAANARDSLDLGYSRNRREFYDVARGRIESRAENIFSAFNILDYALGNTLTTTMVVGVFNRALDKDFRTLTTSSDTVFDTHIDEFRLETQVRVNFISTGGRVAASLGIGHHERSEKHSAKRLPEINDLGNTRQNEIEQRKDNLTSRTSLSGLARVSISSSDTIAASGGASILRYDTPSAENDEDRDEVLLAVTLASTHRVSRYLSLGFSLEGTLSHTVYLFSERSENNNINRVLRFAPRTVFRPTPWLTTVNAFEVLANYTVYDFEQIVFGVQSFSYRQFGWLDSTSVEITGRIGLDVFSYFKFYERGQLRWAEFSERTENSFVDKTIAGQIRFSPSPSVLFAAGLRFFSQSRYVFNEGVRSRESYFRSIGPTCSLLLTLDSSMRVSFTGWYERTRLSGAQALESVRDRPNFTMNIFFSI
jgi:hypothetical protein